MQLRWPWIMEWIRGVKLSWSMRSIVEGFAASCQLSSQNDARQSGHLPFKSTSSIVRRPCKLA